MLYNVLIESKSREVLIRRDKCIFINMVDLMIKGFGPYPNYYALLNIFRGASMNNIKQVTFKRVDLDDPLTATITRLNTFNEDW